jgi:hypothetical protein
MRTRTPPINSGFTSKGRDDGFARALLKFLHERVLFGVGERGRRLDTRSRDALVRLLEFLELVADGVEHFFAPLLDEQFEHAHRMGLDALAERLRAGGRACGRAG